MYIGKIQKFRRSRISFFGISSYQVIISGSKIDNFGARKSAHPVMYHSTILIHFPRSSLRTDRQTNKQKDMLILLIYKTSVSPVTYHSCSHFLSSYNPFLFPVLVSYPRSPSPFPFPIPVPRTPFPVLVLFHVPILLKVSPSLPIDHNMNHVSAPSIIFL